MSDASFRVLVVDDHVENLWLAQAFLEPLECVIETAGNGIECLEQVHRQPPDLILLDVLMPKMDGLEVCRRLKAHPQHQYIPIVLLTGLNLPGDRVAGIEAGADDFVSKPFNRLELVARVKSLLRVKRLEDHERARIRTTLERYLDSSVAQELLDRADLAAPGGQRVDASVLFADIRGFTAWCEAVATEDVVAVLNEFLSRAVEIVFKHGGAVDKFTGDGVMALFGAPVPSPSHPRRAVAAALEIVEAGTGIEHALLLQPLQVGCGVSSGDMIVGNIGSERRLDFTAIGDEVNVARRLCDEASGGQVLVTEHTYRRLKPVRGKELDLLQLRHRQEPVRAYAVHRLL